VEKLQVTKAIINGKKYYFLKNRKEILVAWNYLLTIVGQL